MCHSSCERSRRDACIDAWLAIDHLSLQNFSGHEITSKPFACSTGLKPAGAALAAHQLLLLKKTVKLLLRQDIMLRKLVCLFWEMFI